MLGEPARLDPRRGARPRAPRSASTTASTSTPTPASRPDRRQRQRVEIIKCLRRDPTILVFDEPTSRAHAGGERAAVLGAAARSSSSEGATVALVSHKLDEILPATDEVTIMRDGRVVERLPDRRRRRAARWPGDGRPRGLAAVRGRGARRSSDTRSRRWPPTSRRRSPPKPSLRSRPRRVGARPRRRDRCSIDTRRSWSTPARSSASPASRATASGRWPTCCRASLRRSTRARSRSAGVAGADRPARRDGRGRRRGHPRGPPRLRLRARLTVAENIVPSPTPTASPGAGCSTGGRCGSGRPQLIVGVRDHRAGARRADALAVGRQPAARRPRPRAVGRRRRVLVAAQPTRGLDVGAIEYMGARLRAAAESGVGVLLISTELEEMLALADRIVRRPPRADRRRDGPRTRPTSSASAC